MSKKTTHAARRGRPREYDARITARVTSAQLLLFVRLGDGDIAAGVRRAAEIAMEAAKEKKGKIS